MCNYNEVSGCLSIISTGASAAFSTQSTQQLLLSVLALQLKLPLFFFLTLHCNFSWLHFLFNRRSSLHTRTSTFVTTFNIDLSLDFFIPAVCVARLGHIYLVGRVNMTLCRLWSLGFICVRLRLYKKKTKQKKQQSSSTETSSTTNDWWEISSETKCWNFKVFFSCCRGSVIKALHMVCV